MVIPHQGMCPEGVGTLQNDSFCTLIHIEHTFRLVWKILEGCLVAKLVNTATMLFHSILQPLDLEEGTAGYSIC